MTAMATGNGVHDDAQSRHPGQIRLGITGGIGSGKSYVAQMLQARWDVPVYDCDSEAKRLTAESDDIRTALTQLVGDHLWQQGQMLKPMLARGELHCIGATTLDEYRQYIEKDPALERRFRRYCRLFRLGAVPPHGLAHRSQHQGGAVFRTEILGILIDFMTFGTGFHDLLLCFFWGCFA